MIFYIDFYIDAETHEIHQSVCDYLSAKNKIYLGIYKNLEIALNHAKSKGFTRASVCNSCNISF